MVVGNQLTEYKQGVDVRAVDVAMKERAAVVFVALLLFAIKVYYCTTYY